MSNFVLRGCGIVLLAAVALKVHGLSSGTSSVNYFSPAVQLAALEIETVVGLWLLVGWARRPAWAAAMLLFAVLAAVSFYLAVVGQASCGCLGRVPISPWWTFGLDVAAIVLLFITRPTRFRSRAGEHAEPMSLQGILFVGACTVIGGGLFVWHFGSPEAVVAAVRGDPLVVRTPVIDLGEGVRGNRLVGRVTVANVSTRSIRLVGGTTDCTCATTADLPVTVSPGEEVDFQVRVTVNGTEPGVGTQQAWVWTDAPEQPRLHVVMRYRVGSSDTASGD